MLKFLDEVFRNFRSCFSRTAAFEWFVVIVIGLMIRSDHLGITSVIRDLWLNSDYVTMMGFFRSTAWSLEGLIQQWCQTVLRYAPLIYMDDRMILIGDGMKQTKEGRRMPGVKRLHQESENSGKPSYMYGHMFGAIGILAGVRNKQFCIPLAIQIQDGVKTILGWQENPERQGSHVEEMIRLACNVIRYTGKSAILLLDRYFLSVKALQQAAAGNIHIITKAKSSCVAYEDPVFRQGARGRPPKKGAPVKLIMLFETEDHLFKEAQALLYGKQVAIRYHLIDLLWGQKLYQRLRFVLVWYDGLKSIMVSTDLSLDPVRIVELYAKRFRIETTFRELHQVVNAFSYRFWSKHMPKLKRYRKKNEPDPLDSITGEKERKRIGLALRATEVSVFCASVAMGLLQMISLHFSGTSELSKCRYQRTYRSDYWSEDAVADYLSKNIYRLLVNHPHLSITRFIWSRQYDIYEQNTA